MLLNSLEPSRPEPPAPAAEATSAEVAAPAEGGAEPRGGWFNLGIDYRYYPLVYAIKVALTGLFMLALWREYAALSWRVSPLAVLLGAVGVVAWVGITELRLEPKLLEPLGLGGFLASGARAAYNPLAELRDWPGLGWGFLAVRFLGLAAIVPVIEEMFLRGFLMRFITDQKWWSVPLVAVSWTAILVTTGAAMAMHPAELLAMLVWFSMVTWLMLRSGNITDCIVAHAVTNLLLGIYVVTTGSWSYM
jgi:CAAX prenyl protease-like protein